VEKAVFVISLGFLFDEIQMLSQRLKNALSRWSRISFMFGNG